MEIFSKYQPEKVAAFDTLRKNLRWYWYYFCKGEWSQSAYHQGNEFFELGNTSKGDYLALKARGFPSRIICIAKCEAGEEPNKIVGAMLYHLYSNGGEYIDFVHDIYYDIDEFNEAWEEYERLKDRRNLQE